MKEEDFQKAKSYLRSLGCKEKFLEVEPSWLFRQTNGGVAGVEWQFTAVGQYSRFMCPKAVQVDLIDDKAFRETLDTMPSDVHFLVKKKNGLVSYDEERFPTSDLLDNMKKKIYHGLLLPPWIGCEKLEKEGFISQTSKE